jgi:hypothetical protein
MEWFLGLMYVTSSQPNANNLVPQGGNPAFQIRAERILLQIHHYPDPQNPDPDPRLDVVFAWGVDDDQLSTPSGDGSGPNRVIHLADAIDVSGHRFLDVEINVAGGGTLAVACQVNGEFEVKVFRVA